MSEYQEYGINISVGQFRKIPTAGKRDGLVTIRIAKKNLRGDHKLLLTKTKINKLRKATSGLDLNLSRSQVNKIFQKF